MDTATAPGGSRTSEVVDAAGSLFAALGEALLCLDSGFTIVYAASFLDRLVGTSCAARIRGVAAEAVFGEDLFGIGSALRAGLRSGRRADGVRATFRPGDGSVRAVVLGIARVESDGEGPLDGSVVYVVTLRAPAQRSAADEAASSPAGDPEMIRIREALEAHRWRREDAAHALGISRTTLWRKMREYGLL